MSEMNISSVTSSDMTNAVKDYSVDSAQTDAATGNGETSYINTNWSKQLGIYKKHPAIINTLARWVIGKGYKSNEITMLALMEIKGYGKDSFNSILKGLSIVKKIGGDSFAEIIRDEKGKLVNLKPLDPSVIKIVTNSKGIIIRYEQVSKADRKKKTNEFKPDEIFHLSRNRIADEIHGQSMIDEMEDAINSREEATKDMRILMHRHVKPIVKWQLDTDDTAEIAAFKVKADAAVENGENLYIPMGAADADYLSLPANATLNPLPWIEKMDNYSYKIAGVPQIVAGGSIGVTESADKISYVSFEQTVEEEQLYIEEQVLSQLNLEIELETPASLTNELISDQSKSETTQAATPEDTAVTGAIQ